MITRMMNTHQYAPAPYPQVNYPGSVKTVYIKNIPTVWPVTRPMSAPITPNPQSGYLLRGGTGMFRMQLTAPNVEMDPSNPATWQRQYQF